MHVPIFRGHVDKAGKVQLENAPRLTMYLRTLAGKDIELTIKRKPSKRTLDQNAYWWAVPVRILADHCGEDAPSMHYALLGECFGYHLGPVGKDIPNKPSSSTLTVEEFTHLIEWVLEWAPRTLNVFIPAPGEVEAA